MKNSKENLSYGPEKRDFMEAPQKEVKSYSPKKDYTLLPDNVTDRIAVNNIAYQEFDYTYGDVEHDELHDLAGVEFKETKEKPFKEKNHQDPNMKY